MPNTRMGVAIPLIEQGSAMTVGNNVADLAATGRTSLGQIGVDRPGNSPHSRAQRANIAGSGLSDSRPDQ